VTISSDGLSVTNAKGYRMTKATHGVESGTWYYEATIQSTQGMTRLGYAQISADLQGPCGIDVFSYSWRGQPSTVFHQSTGRSFGSGYSCGDTIGCLIHIPELTLDEQRDLEERRMREGYEYTQFHHPCPPDSNGPMRRKRFSQLVYFCNGVLVGVAFTDVFLGKYYPAISCYEDAQVRVNFGPSHACPAVWNDQRVRLFSELETTAPVQNGDAMQVETVIVYETDREEDEEEEEVMMMQDDDDHTMYY
jgi:hypothetical protein